MTSTQQIKQKPSWEQYHALSSTHCRWELLISLLCLTTSTTQWRIDQPMRSKEPLSQPVANLRLLNRSSSHVVRQKHI